MPLSTRISLVMVALALAITAMIALAVDTSIQQELAPVEIERQSYVAQQMSSDLQTRVHGVRADALVVLRSSPVLEFAQRAKRGEPIPDALQREVVESFSAQLSAKPSYLQVRLIGNFGAGEELVRVERSHQDSPVQVIPASGLQRKGGKDYVQAALALPPGDVHISPIEPNMEHGKVQRPIVPVLRASTPVIDDGGKAIAAVVINVDMSEALKPIRGKSESDRVTYLVNAQGNYVVHPNRDYEFTTDHGLGDVLPALAGALSNTQISKGEFEDVKGKLYSVAAVPVVLADGPTAFVVTTVPSARLATARSARRTTVLAALLAAAAAAAIAFFIARSVTRPLAEMRAAAEGVLDGQPTALPTKAPGEVGVLARALERMRETIRERNTILEQQEQRFRDIVERTPSALIIVDTDSNITLTNRHADRLFGYHRDELVGQPIGKLIPERFRGHHFAFVQGFFANPQARSMGAGRDLFALRKDGSEIPVEIGLNPIENADGAFTLASVVDISARLKEKAELQRSNTELSQFAYIASHDLQEPLRMVASYTELLSQQYADQLDEDAQTYIQYALDGSKRMQRLIADLLAYSRLDAKEASLDVVDSETVLHDVQKILEAKIQEADAIVESGPLPNVLCDAGQLSQLFQNLLGNALKFTGERPCRVSVTATRDGERFRFAVKDNGLGIELRHQKRIFQMFQRLQPRGDYEGTGIGLAIAKRIVERHGERIWLESEVGVGTTFFFTLQAAPDADADD